MPGTTRDSVDAEFTWEGRKFLVTDTAGLRKKAKVHDDVEYYSNMRSLESIRRSEVVILLMDSLQDELPEQDLRILRQVEESGKGIVLGLSKWDALEKDHRTFDELVKEMRARIPSLAETPIVAFSGKTGQRVPRLLEEVLRVREGCQRVLGRDNVIEYFRLATEKQKPAHQHGHPVIITRCCQVMVDPPTLAFEVDQPEEIQESYRRYLRARAIDYFDLAGVPVRIAFRNRLELRTDEDLARFGHMPEGYVPPQVRKNIRGFMNIWFALPICYLLGSIPSAIWISRIFGRIDIRQHGSRNAGLTNVYRVLGWKPAAPVAIIDFAKGLGAGAPRSRLGPRSPGTWIMATTTFALACGLCAVLGHTFTMFAGFKGGKGGAHGTWRLRRDFALDGGSGLRDLGWSVLKWKGYVFARFHRGALSCLR